MSHSVRHFVFVHKNRLNFSCSGDVFDARATRYSEVCLMDVTRLLRETNGVALRSPLGLEVTEIELAVKRVIGIGASRQSFALSDTVSAIKCIYLAGYTCNYLKSFCVVVPW